MMEKNQILKLAQHLKRLAEKLDENGETDWTEYVMGDLNGIAEMLILQTENTENK